MNNNGGRNDEYNNGGYNNGGYNNGGYNNGGYNNGGYNNSGYNNGGYNNGGYNNGGYNNGVYNNGGYNNGGYNNGGYNNSGYNNSGNNNIANRDPRIPESIYRDHPDARLVTKKEGLISLIVISIICIGLIAGFIGIFVLAQTSKEENERIMKYNETTDGVVTKTWTTKTGSGRSRKTVYHAAYKYTYNYIPYTGQTRINKNSLNPGDTVTVYVDPDNPGESRLYHDNSIAHYLMLVSIVPVAIFWISMMRKYNLCRHGLLLKYSVYSPKYKNGVRWVWREIK